MQVDSFPVTDSHVHFWNPGKEIRYPWLENVSALNHKFELEEYRDVTKGVDVQNIVFVECDAHVEDTIKEVEYVSHLATRDARIKAIVACAPVERGESGKNICINLLVTYLFSY